MNRRYTANVEAYQLYLKGRHHWNRRTVEALWVAARFDGLRAEPRFGEVLRSIVFRP